METTAAVLGYVATVILTHIRVHTHTHTHAIEVTSAMTGSDINHDKTLIIVNSI